MREPSPLVPAVSSSANVTTTPFSSLTSTSPKLFTSDQHQLFQTRYAEGFDLPDPDYSAWLAIYHPEKLSSSAADSLVTHVSGCSLEQKKVDSNSDALSEVLSLPQPTATRRKRRPGLNSKSITLTDDEAIKSKEADKLQKETEKEAKKIQREQRKKEQEQKKKDKQLRKKGQTNNKQVRRKGSKLAASLLHCQIYQASSVTSVSYLTLTLVMQHALCVG